MDALTFETQRKVNQSVEGIFNLSTNPLKFSENCFLPTNASKLCPKLNTYPISKLTNFTEQDARVKGKLLASLAHF